MTSRYKFIMQVDRYGLDRYTDGFNDATRFLALFAEGIETRTFPKVTQAEKRLAELIRLRLAQHKEAAMTTITLTIPEVNGLLDSLAAGCVYSSAGKQMPEEDHQLMHERAAALELKRNEAMGVKA